MPRKSKRHLIALAVAMATPTIARAEDVSAPAILQYFESTYGTIENRLPDVLNAGYGIVYTPPPGRADQGNLSVGYDVYDRFDLGSPNDPTLYGTQTGLQTLINQTHMISASSYIDLVWNHNGYSDWNTSGFPASGGYPGFVLSAGADASGDFHANTETGDQNMRLAGLLDIAQDKNYQYIRSPVPGFANNLPAGTTPDGAGRLANVPTEANRALYADTNGPYISVYDPTTGEGDIHIYKYNTATPSAGDPISENALGYLMRNAQWLVQVIGADGFRLDATKNYPSWVLNYLDRAIYRQSNRTLLDGSQENPFSFGEAFDTNKAYLQTLIRKDINPNDIGTVGGNRDVLDFPLYYAMQDNLSGNGLQNDWHNVVNASQDVNDDAFANNGSQAVGFVSSADNGPPALENVAYAYTLLRPGNAVVYFNAHEFGDNTQRAFPRDGRGDALGGVYGDHIPKLVDIRNRYGRGNYQERWIEKEILAYERQGSALILLNNRVTDAGYDERTMFTGFAPGTHLVELTGNSTDPNVDTFNDIHDVLTVDASGNVTARFLRNSSWDAPYDGTHSHFTGNGYLIYGLKSPEGTLSLTNTSGQLTNQTPTTATNGTVRLATVKVVTANSFQTILNTNAVTITGDHGESFREQDADGDNALLRLDGGFDANGNGHVDYVTPGSVAYGFEEFLTAKTAGYTAADGNGVYTQTIDATQLSEGMHYITVRARFRHRGDGGPAIFTDFHQTVYVDRLPPVSAVASFLPWDPNNTKNRDLTIQSVDKTADSVHEFLNLPAGLTDAQILAMISNGNQSSKIDRDQFKYGFSNVQSGNNVATVVTYEITGNYSIQRFPGLLVSTNFGAGFGDLSGDGLYAIGDMSQFGGEVNSNNTLFNPAGDLNGDGLVNDVDNVLMVPWLTHLNTITPNTVNVGTMNTAVNNRVSRAMTTGTFDVPSGSLNVSGAIVPGVPITVTNSFNIPANFTVTKTGGEALNINGAQSHGVNSVLAVADGAVNFGSSDSGTNLTVNTTTATATVNFNASVNRLKTLNVNAGSAALASGQKVLIAQNITTAGGKFDLRDGRAILRNMARADVETLVRSGYDAGAWDGTGITSSTAAATPNNATSVAVVQASQGGFTTFSGQTVSGTDILVKYTYNGDADLSGSVNFDDFNKFLSGFNHSAAPSWFSGDFNYSGAVDFDDFNKFVSGLNAFNANPTLLLAPAEFAGPAAITFSAGAVPEPAMLSLAAPALMMLARRRRKTREG